MSQRVYHLGRRKRRIIMRERAMGAALSVGPAERQVKLSPDLRELLEALIDADAAYNGEANKDRCLVAGELALNKRRNTIDPLISQLELAGFVSFESFQGGAKLVIRDETLLAFKKLERFEMLIDTVTRVEDSGIEVTEQVQASIDELTEAGVYISCSDDDLDAMMRDQIDPVIKELQEIRELKRQEARLRKEGKK